MADITLAWVPAEGYPSGVTVVPGRPLSPVVLTVSPAKGDKGDAGDQGIQGPQGNTGNTGATGPTGPTGQAAYTLTTAAYAQPPVSSTVTVSVQSSAWLAVGSLVRTPGGDYEVTALPTSTTVTLENLGYPGAASPGATVASGSSVTATGARGADGASGATAAWSAATPYTAGMIATLAGVSYVCVLGHTNQTPPNVTYWKAAIVEGDSRLSDARAPSGSAGGDLTGTYPNPTIAAGAIGASKITASTNGFVLTTAAGAAAWAQIVNANVDAAAAIDGSKINPAFAAQDITGTARLTVGTGHTNTAATNSACVGGNAATIATGCTNATTSGGLTNSIAKGIGHHIAGSTLCTIGNASLAAGNYDAIIACTSCNIGTVTAGGTNCGIFASNGSSIQGASANCSITGGVSITITNCTGAHVASGFSNSIASGANHSSIGGGLSNVIGANAEYSSVGGGTSCTVNSTRSFVGGGVQNICAANATGAGILCGIGGNATLSCQQVHSGGYTSAIGEAQASTLIIRGTTSGAQTVSLLCGGRGGAPTDVLATTSGRSYALRGLVTCHKTVSVAADVLVAAAFEVFALVVNNGGTCVVQQYTVTTLPGTLPTGLVGSTVTVTPSGANIVITGDIGATNTTPTKWGGKIEWVEVA